MVGTRNPLEPTFWVSARNPSEPTFWVSARNPEPTGTLFGPMCLEPGTHIFEIRVGSTRNPGTHDQFRTCRPLVGIVFYGVTLSQTDQFNTRTSPFQPRKSVRLTSQMRQFSTPVSLMQKTVSSPHKNFSSTHKKRQSVELMFFCVELTVFCGELTLFSCETEGFSG